MMICRAICKRTAQFAVLLASVGGTVLPAGAQTANATFKVVCIANRDAVEITKRKACIQSTPQLSFRDQVTLAVEHAPNVDFDDTGEPNPTSLVLFLEGKALPATNASVGLSQTDNDDVTTTLLTFRIAHDVSREVGRTNWREVLVAAQNHPTLAISTGLENGPAAQSEARIEFVPVRGGWLMVWFFLAIVGAVLFFVVAAFTNFLRDQEPEDPNAKLQKPRAFSLARVQMALWTVAALYAYLFVWMLTGEYNGTIPASIVALMGITATTLGAAASVDATSKQKACESEGFFQDLVTSAEGASLHRLQFVVWTLALLAVFVVTVWKTLAMPDFDSTMLGLMGISSGTYVGLKLPEKKA